MHQVELAMLRGSLVVMLCLQIVHQTTELSNVSARMGLITYMQVDSIVRVCNYVLFCHTFSKNMYTLKQTYFKTLYRNHPVYPSVRWSVHLKRTPSCI